MFSGNFKFTVNLLVGAQLVRLAMREDQQHRPAGSAWAGKITGNWSGHPSHNVTTAEPSAYTPGAGLAPHGHPKPGFPIWVEPN
jgi:hypothetical protein